MRKYLSILAILSVLLHLQCQKKRTADLEAIKGHWVHSYEEDKADGYSTYRPHESQEFPASRFRQVFQFKNNDACSYLTLEPNDAHSYKDGYWQYDDDTGILQVFDDATMVYEFRVVEVNSSLLKIKMLSQ